MQSARLGSKALMVQWFSPLRINIHLLDSVMSTIDVDITEPSRENKSVAGVRELGQALRILNYMWLAFASWGRRSVY